MAPVKSKKAPKVAKKYTVDVAANKNGDLIDMSAYEKYLSEHIKVEGKTGQLGDQIQVSRSGNKLTIVSYTKFSGKYVKYLTKRFLKKNNLRDWLRVVSVSRGVYEIRFFNLVTSDDEAEEDDDEEDDE